MSTQATAPAAPRGKTAPEQIDNHHLTGHQKSLIGMAIVGNVSEFFDMFLIGFIINLLIETPGWNLTGFHSGVILAGSGLGTVLGSITWGRLADVFGRKAAFIWCIVVLVVFTAGSAFTPVNGWILLAILRTGVGFGVGGLNITSVPFVQEFVPAKQRGLLAGLTSVFIPAGIFLGGLVTKYFGDALGWRGLIAVGCIPIVLLAWARIIPESPRFLQSRGRDREAKEAYAWAMEIPMEQVADLPDIKETSSASYSVIFKKYPKQLLVVAVGSFCFIMGSFTVQSWGQTLLGQSFKFSAGAVATLFMFVSLGDLLGRLGSAWISDKIGRRWTMFGCGMIGAVGALIAAFSTRMVSSGGEIGNAGYVFFAGIFIVMMFGDGAFGILNAFGGEQFPTEARSTGLGLGYGIGAIAKVVGPYFVGALVGSSELSPEVVFLPFIIFAVLLFLGGVVYLFARETKGAALEDI
ncbi:MAG: MFS transporter [Actinomyces succiniciruminis]|uniref:Transporter, major facilitator protein n=1 Tax=Actinomyces succiniciruminis TaxID=1522002 RepID=A0A1L7RDM9_9ACTO|nr:MULTISPECIES: MFS transporter [Actinomyces]MBE6475271.1 MFS transporter [Actinomyces succiniciruminis]MBM6980307.1 MFS transporter [Actinomyces succiniciruminis]RAX19979.1 MFS transporter [Actinomyces sp. Z5]CED92115.1 Transporter, major facilitator protein [Actinomyces succiniciruminis]